MKFKTHPGYLFLLLIIFFTVKAYALTNDSTSTKTNDSIPTTKHVVYDLDQLLDSIYGDKPDSLAIDSLKASSSRFHQTVSNVDTTNFDSLRFEKEGIADSIIEADEKRIENKQLTFYELISSIRPVKIDPLTLENNPLFIDLVYKPQPDTFNWKKHLYKYKLFFGKKPHTFMQNLYTPIDTVSNEKIIQNLRQSVIKYLVLHDPNLFVFRESQLPSVKDIKTRKIKGRPLKRIDFANSDFLDDIANQRIRVKKVKVGYWTHKANALAQFSQNAVTNNWYQGGNSNMSVLGVLSAELNYNNKKNIQFENDAEWRMGFYYLNDSTALRSINVNNDLLRIDSKLGYKINGNWYYSGSVEFSTQFLNNYKSVTSDVLKATFLTPVRLNVGIGLDYKYKDIFSLSLSPLAYKYIYLNEKDASKINPNLFGIEKGQDRLKQIGSSFNAQMSYAPFKELQLTSRLAFFTNYKSIEVDWEIVGNFTINRYLSTRISLHPRYDNSVILPAGEKASIQFKELMSFGFNYNLFE